MGASCILSSGEAKISLTGLYTDESAPEIFTLKMKQGARTGLRSMNSILISASAAKVSLVCRSSEQNDTDE